MSAVIVLAEFAGVPPGGMRRRRTFVEKERRISKGSRVESSEACTWERVRKKERERQGESDVGEVFFLQRGC